MDTAVLAGSLHDAERSAQPIPVPDEEITLEEGYAAQREGVSLRVADGRRQLGWKIGLTTAASREVYGVDTPVWAPLLDARISEGDVVDLTGLIAPLVEIEVIVTLAAPVPPGTDAAGVLAATGELALGLEIVDSRWSSRPDGGGLVADGVASAGAVIGPAFSPRGGLVGTAVHGTVGSGANAAFTTTISEDPFELVAWLAQAVSEHGLHLASGDTVLSGSVIAPTPIRAGDRVYAEFAGLGVVDVRFR